MSKELARFIQPITIDLAAFWLQLGEGGIKPEGKPHLRKFLELIKNGSKAALSDNIHILDGYDYTSSVLGLENLEALKGKNIFLVGNHSSEGPLRGHGQILLTSFYVKNCTDQEIRWVHGSDKTTVQELSRKQVEKTFNTIPVGDGDGSKGVRMILGAFKNQESVGIYPEGNGYKELHKGDPRAGRIILYAVKNNIPIICASTGFRNGVFSIAFSLLDSSSVIKLENESDQKNAAGEKIIDYAMETIAQHLTPDRRGHYSYTNS